MSIKNMDWKKDPTQLGAVCRTLDKDHAYRLSLDRAQLRYYYSRPIGADIRDPNRMSSPLYSAGAYASLGENLSEELIDAACAQVVEDLRANVEPRAAGASMEIQCRNMGLAVDGIFDQVGFDDLAEGAVLDGAVCTLGGVHWYLDDASEIRCERFDPLSARWHVSEGRDPLHFYLTQAMARDIALARWTHAKAQIENAPTWSEVNIVGVDSPGVSDDSIRIDIGYCRSEGRTPGRYVMACGTGQGSVLEDGKWPHSFLPFAVFRWKWDHRGYGGVPLSRSVIPVHARVNDLDDIARDSLRGAVPSLMVHEDDITDSISDLPWQKIMWTGNRKPEVNVPNPVSPQIFEQIDRKKTGVYSQTGVNQSAAAGMRPTGLNSAPAQREWIDIAANRLKKQKSAFRRLYADSARIVIGLGAVAYADREQVVRAPGTAMLRTINWKEMNLKENQYQIKFTESSGLSKTFAARSEEIRELKDAGGMSAGAALRALSYRMPDVNSAASRANAAEDLANHLVEQAKTTTDGMFSMPPSIDATCIESVITIGTQEYERALMDGQTPPENMELLRRLIKAAKAKQKPPVPPAAPPMPDMPPPMDGGPPPPMPPPDMGPPPGDMPMPPSDMPPENLPPMEPPQ